MKLVVPTVVILLIAFHSSEARLAGRFLKREKDENETRKLPELAVAATTSIMPVKEQIPDESLEVMCTAAMKQCPNGAFVGPDPKNDCKFPACPSPAETCCDPMMPRAMRCAEGPPGCCDNGNWVCAQNGVYDCKDSKTKEPPKGQVCKEKVEPGCSKDLQGCPNGPPVARDPKNNCEFFPCADIKPTACKEDARVCPDGTTVVRDPNNDCEFFPCKTIIKPQACKSDIKLCPDGSEVKREPTLNCEFPHCVTIKPQGTASDREKTKATREAERLRREQIKEKVRAAKEKLKAARLAEREQAKASRASNRGGQNK